MKWKVIVTRKIIQQTEIEVEADCFVDATIKADEEALQIPENRFSEPDCFYDVDLTRMSP